jgi:hypothetical protein
MDQAALLENRKAKDEFFGTSHQSPLDHEAQAGFQGLAYFKPDPDLLFKLDVEPGDGIEVKVQTSDGQVRLYQRVGLVHFDVDDVATSLTLYSTGHTGLFVPFRDATSGKSTYGAGRYLDLEEPVDGVVTLDFNEAYNPYCVYNEAYSCPLPPHENWLTVPIEAGEMDYKT